MHQTATASARTLRPIRHLRWYIAGLLFLATTINYVDRQVFSILAPDLQKEIGWSELGYARIVIAFVHLPFAFGIRSSPGSTRRSSPPRGRTARHEIGQLTIAQAKRTASNRRRAVR